MINMTGKLFIKYDDAVLAKKFTLTIPSLNNLFSVFKRVLFIHIYIYMYLRVFLFVMYAPFCGFYSTNGFVVVDDFIKMKNMVI